MPKSEAALFIPIDGTNWAFFDAESSGRQGQKDVVGVPVARPKCAPVYREGRLSRDCRVSALRVSELQPTGDRCCGSQRLAPPTPRARHVGRKGMHQTIALHVICPTGKDRLGDCREVRWIHLIVPRHDHEGGTPGSSESFLVPGVDRCSHAEVRPMADHRDARIIQGAGSHGGFIRARVVNDDDSSDPIRESAEGSFDETLFAIGWNDDRDGAILHGSLLSCLGGGEQERSREKIDARRPGC